MSQRVLVCVGARLPVLGARLLYGSAARNGFLDATSKTKLEMKT